MNIICEYIKYIIKAQGRHKIHSPFVFDFVDVCLNQKIDLLAKKKLKEYNTTLFADKKKYIFDTFGAGSKNKRRVSNIKELAKKAGTRGKYWDLLYKLSKHYKPNSILELGTNLGFGTLAFNLGHPTVNIDTIEGSRILYEVNIKNLKRLNNNKINLFNSTFETFFDKPNKTKYDLVFIDGDHTCKKLFLHLEKVMHHIHQETIIIIDDIRWSDDMYNGWKQIVDDKRFNLTIDLFKIGIIILKKNKEKEHFIIRY